MGTHFKRGRPPLYNNCLDFAAMCELYFEHCDTGREKEVYDKKRQTVHKYNEAIPYTVPGLAYFLGFNHRRAIHEMLQREEFSPTATRALLRIEQQRNEQLLDGTNPLGKQFDLKNNFKWKDKTEQEISGSLGLDDLLRAIGAEDPGKANAIRDKLKVLASKRKAS